MMHPGYLAHRPELARLAATLGTRLRLPGALRVDCCACSAWTLSMLCMLRLPYQCGSSAVHVGLHAVLCVGHTTCSARQQ